MLVFVFICVRSLSIEGAKLYISNFNPLEVFVCMVPRLATSSGKITAFLQYKSKHVAISQF